MNIRLGLLSAIVTAVIFACIYILLLIEANAQEHHHPTGIIPGSTGKFYDEWKMPDDPKRSCCSKADCYDTPARRTANGNWLARRREDGKWLHIPPAKVEMNKESPDGQSHICAPSPYYVDDYNGSSYYDAVSEIVYCFVPGDGT